MYSSDHVTHQHPEQRCVSSHLAGFQNLLEIGYTIKKSQGIQIIPVKNKTNIAQFSTLTILNSLQELDNKIEYIKEG